jgi:hypothetical protein
MGMMQIDGSASTAGEIARWLHENHKHNRRQDLKPVYGSWLNQAVVWRSHGDAWQVSHKRHGDRSEKIHIEIKDPQDLMEVMLRWG